MDFTRDGSAKAEIPLDRVLAWIGLASRKFRDWRARYGKANEHNGQVPRDHWLEPAEKEAITAFFQRHPLEGYGRLAFMMLDQDVAAASSATVYRVLKKAGLLGSRWNTPSLKGTGFEQPLQPHEHWHIDFSHVNVGGTFYCLCSVLDGCSRAIVHWEIREAMRESDAGLVLQRAREKHPGSRPRVIWDNRPQFVAKDFKEYIRLRQASHGLTSPHYPQSNGKLDETREARVRTVATSPGPASLRDRPESGESQGVRGTEAPRGPDENVAVKPHNARREKSVGSSDDTALHAEPKQAAGSKEDAAKNKPPHRHFRSAESKSLGNETDSRTATPKRSRGPLVRTHLPQPCGIEGGRGAKRDG